MMIPPGQLSCAWFSPSGDANGWTPCEVAAIRASIDRGEVLRYLGYAQGAEPSRQLSELLDATIAEAADLAAPRAVYAVFPVIGAAKQQLILATAAGQAEFHGAIGEFLGPVQFAAAFIASAGTAIESRSRELMTDGDYLGSLIYDAVGSERAEAAETAVTALLREQLAPVDMDLTLPYSPGYCGMALTEQIKLFELFGHKTAGVSLTAHCLMQPVKSISGLIGIGPSAAVKQWGAPCERCELWTCHMRR